MTLNPNTLTVGTFQTSSPTTPSTAMTQNLVSGPLDLSKSSSGLILVSWTGTPVGTFYITGSADGINYNVPLIPVASAIPAGGTASSLAYQYSGDCKSAIVNYTFASSTGVWTVASVSTKAPS